MSDLRMHWLIHFDRQFPGWKQKGGAIADGFVTVRGNKLTYRISNDDQGITFIGGGDMEHNPCFTLQLTHDNPTAAILQTVKRRDNCFETYTNESRDIVRAAYKLARQRGVKHIEFTDMSAINCPKDVHLSDLSFLTSGRTWYESILPHAKCIDKPYIEKYREKVKSNTWRQVGDGLIDIDIADVDIDAPGSAMLVLNEMKKSIEFCWFFHRYMDDLLERSDILSLHGSKWICEVKPGLNSRAMTPCSRKSSRLTQKRR